jgi:hypothetical protein
MPEHYNLKPYYWKDPTGNELPLRGRVKTTLKMQPILRNFRQVPAPPPPSTRGVIQSAKMPPLSDQNSYHTPLRGGRPVRRTGCQWKCVLTPPLSPRIVLYKDKCPSHPLPGQQGQHKLQPKNVLYLVTVQC